MIPGALNKLKKNIYNTVITKTINQNLHMGGNRRWKTKAERKRRQSKEKEWQNCVKQNGKGLDQTVIRPLCMREVDFTKTKAELLKNGQLRYKIRKRMKKNRYEISSLFQRNHNNNLHICLNYKMGKEQTMIE